MLVNEIKEFPLSVEQQHLWFHNQIYQNTPIYTNGMALSFNGSLNEAHFAKALGEIITRHEILRSVIAQREDSLYTRISSPSAHIYNTIDYSGLGLEEISIHPHAVSIFRDEMNKVFDLEKGPLIKFILLKYSDSRYVFIIAVHHIVFDGVSFKVFFEELMLFYNAYCKDFFSCPSSLPKVYPYRSFVEDGHKNSEKTLAGEALEYWKKELAELSSLRLPSDLPQTSASPQIKTYKFFLWREIDSKIKNFSSAYSLTSFNVLFSAFCILLYRYSGQEDFTVGVPFQGRDREEIENTIGFFVKMLPIRIRFTHNKMKFLDLASYLMEKTLDAYSYQMVPLTRLITELNIERSANREALFQVGFTVQNTLPLSYKFQDLKCEYLHSEAGRLPLDINMEVYPHLDGYEVFLKYNSQMYTEDTIERMANNWQVLLKDIMDFPHKIIAELDLLTEKEKRKVLSEWNNTKIEFPQNQTVHSLFEEQAEKTPHNTAVVYKQNTLTYKELNEKANMLAHYLREEGVKADMLVAIACERSLDMVIGILAILKAGGAYVPIDPNYPEDRIRFMLEEDTKAPILLTQESLIERLPGTGAKVFLLDKQQESLSCYAATNPPSITQPHHLAYVIYTSGSTGRPKGVMVEHKSVNRLVFNQNYIHLSPSSVIAQAANISFDAATFEIWGALLLGSKLVLMPQDTTLSTSALQKIIKLHEINVMWLTKTLFDQLYDQDAALFKNLDYLLIGGEALDPLRVRKIIEAGEVKNLINGYGPTESTTFAICCNLSRYEALSRCIPIGQPIANTQVYILDSSLRSVPIGVPGELYIGGEGLARGYLNRPELTTERFIGNPFQTEEEKEHGKNGRLYKTGDICRWLEDGNIEYIGRSDDQVKVRGFRIELGEIEAALLQHPQVGQAVVVAREDTLGDKRLVGYVVRKDKDEDKGQKSFKIAELRNHLQAVLPDYMVPSAFVMLEAILLTPNGKIDRKALPAPEYQGDAKTYVAPWTETEKFLAQIIKNVLKTETVGLNDNFFDLGMHSLMLVQFHYKVQKKFNKKFPLIEFYNHTTITKLLNYLTNSSQNSAAVSGKERSDKRKQVNKARLRR